MKYNTETLFPEQVDELIYYSDPSLDHKENLDKYLALYKEGKITEAIGIVADDDSMHYFSADLINKFENQLKTLQEYLLTKEAPENPMTHGKEEPVDPESLFIWVEEID